MEIGINKLLILSEEKREELIKLLKYRFDKNTNRHDNVKWDDVELKLRADPDKLFSVYEMEVTGGEPDVIGSETGKNEYFIYDCSKESPEGRRNICYDQAALDSRKSLKPKNSAAGMAVSMGIEILMEDQYRELQTLGEFDLKTSSWVKTPDNIRKLGGALFCDRRYGTVFTYHNGAESYYGVRGFRGFIKI